MRSSRRSPLRCVDIGAVSRHAGSALGAVATSQLGEARFKGCASGVRCSSPSVSQPIVWGSICPAGATTRLQSLAAPRLQAVPSEVRSPAPLHAASTQGLPDSSRRHPPFQIPLFADQPWRGWWPGGQPLLYRPGPSHAAQRRGARLSLLRTDRGEPWKAPCHRANGGGLAAASRGSAGSPSLCCKGWCKRVPCLAAASSPGWTVGRPGRHFAL